MSIFEGFYGARQGVDDSLLWTEEAIGTVTPRGNIVGKQPGTAWSSGLIWITQEQADIAERFGWQRIPDSQTATGLVKVER